MRPNRDFRNWVPMYGRKVCLEYPGIKRQCSSCYGPHAKKFCRSERCGMESFVVGFSRRYPLVPVDLYGKLSHLAVLPKSQSKPKQSEPNLTTLPQLQPQLQCVTESQSQPVSRSKSNSESYSMLPSGKPVQHKLGTDKAPTQSLTQLQSQGNLSPDRPTLKLKISLSKDSDGK